MFRGYKDIIEMLIKKKKSCAIYSGPAEFVFSTFQHLAALLSIWSLCFCSCSHSRDDVKGKITRRITVLLFNFEEIVSELVVSVVSSLTSSVFWISSASVCDTSCFIVFCLMRIEKSDVKWDKNHPTVVRYENESTAWMN